MLPSGHFDLARRDIVQIRTSTGKITRKGERIVELELEEDSAEPNAMGDKVARLQVN